MSQSVDPATLTVDAPDVDEYKVWLRTVLDAVGTQGDWKGVFDRLEALQLFGG